MIDLGPWEVDTIVVGDCLDVMRGMPDKCVDLVVTSPPYNTLQNRLDGGSGKGSLAFHKGTRAKRNRAYMDKVPEREYQQLQKAFVAEALRITKGLVAYNHKIRHRSRGGGDVLHPMQWLMEFPLWQEVIWDRHGSIAFNCRRFAPSEERIYFMGKPHWWEQRTSHYLSVWRIRPETRQFGHVCPFPEELPRRCIEAYCPLGGIVFDPFVGSGTTAVAAKKLGRHYFGCDVNAEYVEMARKRVLEVQMTPL